MSRQAVPPGSSRGGPVTTAAAWRRTGLKWPVIGVATVLAAAVAAVTAVAVAAGGEPVSPDPRELLRAPVGPMPSPPEGRRAGLPARCGVSPATLDRAVPSRRDDGGEVHDFGCSWSSDHDGGSFRLSAEIRDTEGYSAQGPMGVLSAALPQEPLKVVAPLGDEAYAHYGRGSGQALIVMRAGDTVVKVRYIGTRDVAHAVVPLPESRLMPLALQAVHEVAQGLGVSGAERPEITDIPAEPPPVQARRGTCAAISERTRQRLAGRLYTSPGPRGRPSFALFAPVSGEPRTDTCSWAGEIGTVRVETMTLAHSFEGTSAQATRTLEWLRWRTRNEGISRTTGARPARSFTLTGRGDGAFAAYEPPASRTGGYGLVAFRVRNAVIVVTYTAAFKRQISQEQAVNGAYTAAVDVAATFTP